MKFAVLSDTHYISLKMLPETGDDAHRLLHYVNKSALAALAGRTDVDTVLITGDLTDDGDECSHAEFAELLRGLQAAGKRVYVLTATHDFHFSRAYTTRHGWPVRYRSSPWERPWFDPTDCDYKALVREEFSHLPAEDCVPPLVKICTPDDLWDIYHDFGPAQAFSVCASAWSYCVKLEEKLWCLMLNNNMRDVDANYDFSASYSPACYRWIDGIMKQARAEGAFVFACTHHPLVPPTPAYKIGGTTRNMRNSYSCHALADLGIPLVFSGHTHFADVAFGSSDKGRVLCDVTTPALSFLPPAYRTAEIFPVERRVKLTVEPVDRPADFPISAPDLKTHLRETFIEEYRRKVDALPHGLGKVTMGLKIKHLAPLCPGCLRREELAQIGETKMFDLVMELAVNMQCGDGRFTPDTPEYRFMTALSAAADSVVNTQPFIDINKKLLGYSISEIVEPLLFNNYVPDNNADFVFDRLPAPNFKTPAPRSALGDVLMAVLSAFALLAVPLAPLAAASALPAMTLIKKRRLKKNPPKPERY